MQRIKRFLSIALALVLVLSCIPASVLAADPAPALPTATVKKINKEDLTFAMNFKVNPVTEEQLATYGNWYADFELTVNKNVTFNNDGSADGYLAGQYDEWSENWVTVPFGKFAPVTLEANKPLKIMAFAAELMDEPGLKYTYQEVYETVKDFDCGVYFDNEFLAANPDLEVKLELKMYNPANENENYVIGETYIYNNPMVAKNTATGKVYTTVNAAMMDCAAGQTVILMKDTADSIVSVFVDTTLDLNGHALAATYVSCFGDIIDSSAANSGVLAVDTNRLMIREDNAQMPVHNGTGYQFVEVLRIDTAMASPSKFAFQPRFEPGMLELLMKGTEVTGITIQVQVSWQEEQGNRTQNFVYNDSLLLDYLDSYNSTTDKYKDMFTLTLNGAENVEGLTFVAMAVSNTKVSASSNDPKPQKPAGNVTTDANNQVVNDVTIGSGNASALVPSGTQLENGANNVTLNATEMEKTTSNITVGDGEKLVSMNVHVDGVAANNTKPIIVTLTNLAPEFLNQGNLSLYHVENGETVEMTRVYALADVDAHNEYYYDIATGTITMALATFSEVALVAEDAKWEGNFDYSWYTKQVAKRNNEETVYEIYNADQLAALSAIVGGMNGQTQDSFAGKTVKLMADIDLNDVEGSENDWIFYPIGYYNSEGTYERTNTAITSGLRNFEGTFDGNGHTVSNFYQNTWEMKGDHDWYSPEEQYYRDGMGLFGRVYGGTVKNLTVKNFSSDGEIATTGVIAAYADGATFENISIFNCNPRVYNIGNGGIVGCVGWYAKEANLKTTFKNITVDNSNKISALWGSYDVACGGIVGQYYPTSGQTSAGTPKNAGIDFVNCHISAQMDVYNDVCANYQYYAYRYTGMLIGSVRENVTIDGHVYPKMDGITASGCTVHFGTWNDYYYCEIIDNTTASYTHDYQMSRLTEIKAIDGTTITYLDGTTGTVPATGRANYVIVDYTKGHGTENATCYHFKDGAVWTHDMGGIQTGIDENGDGQDDLKEDKQHIYLEFNNLVTGYGWGVTSKGVGDLAGVTILDREVGNSVEKFESTVTELANNKTYKLSDIFSFVDNGVELVPGALAVAITNLDENNPVSATIVYDRENWENGTITLSGAGQVTITIQDYYFCTPTTITVTVEDRQSEQKFEHVFPKTSDFLYRVGNQNTVTLGQLFKAKNGVTLGNITVTVETVAGATGAYTPNATWMNGTIQFSGTGVVKVTIKDDDKYCKPTTLYLEVVDAVNKTSVNGTITSNVVLLNDAGLSSLTVSGRYTVYGNGFTLTYTGNGQYLRNGLKQGVVTVKENGTLDNLRIEATVYPDAYMYYGSAALGNAVTSGPSDGNERYYYQLSAVAASDNATISNCYIYGGRNNIYVNTGNVTVKDTVLECGVVANVQIQSSSDYTVTFEDVTTIQHQVKPTIGDTSLVMMGAGILVGPETNNNPTIVLNGEFKQYNWVTAEDKNAVSGEAAKQIINAAVNTAEFNHTVNGKTASNLGIIYMNTYDATVTNNTGLPYEHSTITMNGVSGNVYSLQGATEEQIYSDYENADKSTVNGLYQPQFKYSADLGGQYIAEGGDEHCYREGDTIHVMFPSGDTKELDLAALVNISKYTGQNLGLVITVVDGSGNPVTVTNGKVNLSAADEYTVTYTVTDGLFYDKDGEKIIHDPIEYSWDVTLSVSLKDVSVPDAKFEFVAENQKMGYYKQTVLWSTDVYQYIPFLAGLNIYDYNGQTRYLRFNGDADFNKVASIEVTNKYSGNDALIKVTLTDGGVITLQLLARADSGGGSTYTGSIKTSGNTIYFVNDGTTSDSEKTTTAAYWYVDYYKFTGNNGVEIQSAQQTFNSTGSSASTPSGSFGTTIKYTVTYNANGGDCGQTVGYATSANNNTVTLPTPKRSGYMFVGWFTAASGGTRVGGAGDSYPASANITLYAQWGKPSTVTYDSNGGSVSPEFEKYTGTALILPTPTRDGYWFAGWSDGDKLYAAGASYQASGDITLVAQWSPIYTVSYNANGGAVTPGSAQYKGTSLTLPMPTRDGYAFTGWYTAASGGTKIGDAGATYTPSANITLYAQWKDPVTVTYDATTNGGSCSTTSQTFFGTALTLPTPASRTGYTFNGWYTAASGGTKIGDAGATYTPSANITLYAQWQINSYTITVSATNATVKVNGTTVSNKGAVSIEYGAQVTVEVTYSKNNSQSTTIKGTDGTSYTSPFNMPAQNVTINASSSGGGCVTSDTLVTLANGTQQRLDEVSEQDMFLVWDFVKGEYAFAPASILMNHGYNWYNISTLTFSDGTVVNTINGHGFFHAESNKFVILDENNAADYIGKSFLKQDGDAYSTVTLESVSISTEYTESWSILTAEHYNAVLNGMLTLTPAEVPGSPEYLMPFVIGEDMKYDEAAMQADIEKYGQYTYEDFAAYMTYEQFTALNLSIWKVSVGKGYIAFEDILFLAGIHLN